MRLEGHVIWITGSARRLGREMALACAREGADVIVHCHHSRPEAEEVAGLVREMGRETLVVQGNQGSPVDVSRMVGEIEERFGRLTALVNSAAVFPRERLREITERDFFSVVRTNLYGPFLCSQFCEPLLRHARPGRVVNVTDWAVYRPYRYYAHYMASKGGLHALTRAFARELAPEILVNEIAPGPIIEPEDMTPEIKEKILARLPTGHWGAPKSIANALIFILETDDLCGESIVVDGGRSFG